MLESGQKVQLVARTTKRQWRTRTIRDERRRYTAAEWMLEMRLIEREWLNVTS
jgi:hypothetical protein